jgi:hypothetical protein
MKTLMAAAVVLALAAAAAPAAARPHASGARHSHGSSSDPLAATSGDLVDPASGGGKQQGDLGVLSGGKQPGDVGVLSGGKHQSDLGALGGGKQQGDVGGLVGGSKKGGAGEFGGSPKSAAALDPTLPGGQRGAKDSLGLPPAAGLDRSALAPVRVASVRTPHARGGGLRINMGDSYDSRPETCVVRNNQRRCARRR